MSSDYQIPGGICDVSVDKWDRRWPFKNDRWYSIVDSSSISVAWFCVND